MKTQNRKRAFVGLLLLGLVALVGVSLTIPSTILAEDQGGLGRRALHAADLPGTLQLLAEGPVDIDDVSHPLNLASSSAPEAGREALYTYESAYRFSALNRTYNAVISNYLYQYSSDAEAKNAAAILHNELASVGEEIPFNGFARGVRAPKGKAFTLTGDANDQVYWFVGTSESVLYFVMTNGMEDASVAEAFDATLHSLVRKFR